MKAQHVQNVARQQYNVTKMLKVMFLLRSCSYFPFGTKPVFWRIENSCTVQPSTVRQENVVHVSLTYFIYESIENLASTLTSFLQGDQEKFQLHRFARMILKASGLLRRHILWMIEEHVQMKNVFLACCTDTVSFNEEHRLLHKAWTRNFVLVEESWSRHRFASDAKQMSSHFSEHSRLREH